MELIFFSRNHGVRSGLCSPSFNCGASTSQNCQSIIERYEDQTRRGLEPLEKAGDGDEHQTLKHIVLLIILLCSMFVVSRENNKTYIFPEINGNFAFHRVWLFPSGLWLWKECQAFTWN